MTSKARFNSKSISPGRGTSTSKALGSVSKRVGAGNAITASGYVGSGKSSQVQVIYNGKIATPQSLIPRKSAATAHAGQAKYKGKEVHSTVPTIDETTPETHDRGQHAAAQKATRRLDTQKPSGFIGGSAGNLASLGGQGKKEEEMVTVTMRETATTMLFVLPSFIVASDTRDLQPVEERNARYEAVVQAHKSSDNFVSHPTQTANHATKNQNEMTAPAASQDMGCQATSFEITDATAVFRNNADDIISSSSTSNTNNNSSSMGTDTADLEDAAGLTPAVRKFMADTTNVALVTQGCLLDVNDLTRPRQPGESSKDASGKGKGGARGGKGGATSMAAVVSGGVSGVGVAASTSDNNNNNNNHNPSESGNNVLHGGVSASKDDASGGDVGRNSSAADNDTHNSQQAPQQQLHYNSAQDTQAILRAKEAERILASPMLVKRLQMMERAVQQNSSHRQHLDYRDLPDVPPLRLLKASERDQVANEGGDQLFGGFGGGLGGTGKKSLGKKGDLSSSSSVDFGSEGDLGVEAKEEEPSSGDKRIKRLFCFSNAELIQGRSVNAMAWNAVNTDLLAVGYGKLDDYVDKYKPGEALDERRQGGLVLFWSLRNADYPERILRTKYPVTSLDFSKLSPTMLAVGFMNGDIAIYDTKREADWEKPKESSAHMSNGHSDPVWQVKWVIKGAERIENIVSISTDGNVLEWNLKKGLVVSTLMQLKRVGVVEGWISRQAAGMAIDFMPSDSTTYVVGTEEGSVHRCSVSYNEQYLENYEGHDGPLYRVRFSSRWPDVFLTCSADWTAKLYHLHSKAPLLTMRSSGEDFAVSDICWCPGNSTIFAAVTANAKLQIWDLSVSSIDPVVMIDTNLDDKSQIAAALAAKEANENGDDVVPSSKPTTPAVISRFDRMEMMKEEVKDPPVMKLLKSLTNNKPKRELTCVLFGEKSPTIAVGDNNGSVLLYRIYEPVTITHAGPMQQTMKLRNAIIGLVDPASAAKLRAIEQETMSSSSSTSSHASVGTGTD